MICLGCDVGREDSLDAIGVNAKLGGKVASLEEEVRILSQNMKLLLEHSPDLTRLLAVARTEMRKRKKMMPTKTPVMMTAGLMPLVAL